MDTLTNLQAFLATADAAGFSAALLSLLSWAATRTGTSNSIKPDSTTLYMIGYPFLERRLFGADPERPDPVWGEFSG